MLFMQTYIKHSLMDLCNLPPIGGLLFFAPYKIRAIDLLHVEKNLNIFGGK